MSNVQIPNLPSATSLSGNEELEIVQGGVSRRTTTQAIADLNPPQGTVTQINTSGGISGGPITTTGTIQIQAQGVDNTKLATMAAYTVKGRNAGTTGSPGDITMPALRTMMGLAPSATTDTTNADNITSGQLSDERYYLTLSDAINRMVNLTTTPFESALLYLGPDGWTTLSPGIPGQILRTQGVGVAPEWYTVSGSGTVQQINSGTGLTGGPITTIGTLSIANTGVTAGNYGATNQTLTIDVNAQGQITNVSEDNIAIDASQVTSGILAVARGGTGLDTYTTGDLLYATSSSALGKLTAGTSGYALASNGTGLAPTYKQISITAATSGTLTVARGGTGATTLTGYVKGSGTSALTASATIPNTDISGLGTMSTQDASSVNITGGTIAIASGTVSGVPANANDIANKSYVDGVAQGLAVKAAASWGTTANITLSGLGTQAGGEWTSSLTAGTRILVKNQTNPNDNGIYAAAAGAWTRTADADVWSELVSAFVFIQQGATLADTGWVCTADPGGTIGTNPIVWVQFSGAGAYSAGTGLTLTGTQFSIANSGVAAGSFGSASSVGTFTVNAQGQLTSASSTAIAINASAITAGTLTAVRGGTGNNTYTIGDILYASSSTALTKLSAGTADYVLTSNGAAAAPSYKQVSLTAGVTGTLPVANGGTGTTTLTGYVIGNGTSAMTASATIPVADISGVLPTSKGGSGTSTTFTPGSVVFAGVGGAYTEDNADLFYDAANVRLGIGTATPGATLNVVAATTTDAVRITQTGTGNAFVVEDSASPDSSPFVIDAAGAVIRGYTTTLTAPGNLTQSFNNVSTSTTNAGFSAFQYPGATTTGPTFSGYKSRSNTPGSFTALTVGDVLASVRGFGDTGAEFLEGASIRLSADGSFTSTSTPGRITFLTTPSGSAAVTEVMRIDNGGRVSIGPTAPTTSQTLTVNRAATGNATQNVIVTNSVFQSDVTTAGRYFQSNLSTAAAAFTLPTAIHYEAHQLSIGAGSTVTAQYGFYGRASLTGATSNYGFYGDIPSGTGRWNFYANGTAQNYFNGNVGLGTATTPAVKLVVGSTDAVGLPVGTTAQRPTAATGYIRFNSDLNSFEGYNGSAWSSVGGGATGGGSDKIFIENGQTVTTNYTITAGNNAGTFGPISIASGVTVTVPSGSTWTVV